MAEIKIGTKVQIKSSSVLYNAGETAEVVEINLAHSASLLLKVTSGPYSRMSDDETEWARPNEVKAI